MKNKTEEKKASTKTEFVIEMKNVTKKNFNDGKLMIPNRCNSRIDKDP